MALSMRRRKEPPPRPPLSSKKNSSRPWPLWLLLQWLTGTLVSIYTVWMNNVALVSQRSPEQRQHQQEPERRPQPDHVGIGGDGDKSSSIRIGTHAEVDPFYSSRQSRGQQLQLLPGSTASTETNGRNNYSSTTTSSSSPSHVVDTTTHEPRSNQSFSSRSISSTTTITNNNSSMEYFRVCLTESCLERVGLELARAFPDRLNDKDNWCRPVPQFRPPVSSSSSSVFQNDSTSTALEQRPQLPNRNSVAVGEDGGLILVKVPKAASSTCAGIVLRISNQSSCSAVEWQHREGLSYNHTLSIPNKNRNKNSRHQYHRRPFLLGSLRHPGARAYSTVWFFMLGPLEIEPTDANVIRALNTRRGGKTKGRGGYQYNYLSIEPVASKSVWDAEYPTRVRHPNELYAKLRHLIHTYDFLIVVERMEESVTALALILGIPLSHVLISSAKVAVTKTNTTTTITTTGGGYILSRHGRRKGQCIRPGTQPMSTGVQGYLQSEPWLAMNYADEVLYRAANTSLDHTIARIGPTKFAKALDEYRQLALFVRDYCGSRIGTGCTATGIPIQPMEACYNRDFGCGYECMDEAVVAFERLNAETTTATTAAARQTT